MQPSSTQPAACAAVSPARQADVVLHMLLGDLPSLRPALFMRPPHAITHIKPCSLSSIEGCISALLLSRGPDSMWKLGLVHRCGTSIGVNTLKAEALSFDLLLDVECCSICSPFTVAALLYAMIPKRHVYMHLHHLSLVCSLCNMETWIGVAQWAQQVIAKIVCRPFT